MSTIKCLLTSLLVFVHIETSADVITLGAVAMEAPVEMINRMTPLTAYIAKRIGHEVKFRPAPNLDTAVTDLGDGTVQMAYMTPFAYITAYKKYHAIPLVSPLTYGKATFNLMVVVQKDSPAKSLEDLKGKRFAFGDPMALLQPAVLLHAGVKKQDFSAFAYLKHYDNIAKAILLGDFDGGIMKDTVYDKFAAQGLRVVYTSPPLTSYVFAVNASLPVAMQAKLKEALLSLNEATPEARSVLKALDQGYDGFRISNDKDYDNERALIARLRL